MTLWGTRSCGLFINGLFINDVTGWDGVPSHGLGLGLII